MQANSPASPVATSAATSATAVVELQAKDLPAHCPNPTMPLWSSHPRVFLDLSHGGSATCPYCGTLYKLAPGTVLKAH
ncbi:zinc-finger domain-containing protein [Undibacterium piscinae]|jgi:uncharacterized Zn-finger protein|uniref:Zinc-finger domain-containing protein n=1 Tax=Undibacterium piscinae TaxID=2495591 RepID=A0A6M4A2H1_9BURK|nr:zinc-finger domain-containing protein [Undibacterium piscinae]